MTTTTTPKPHVGMRFVHSGFCRGEREPECIISHVTPTTVYYWTERGRRASCDILAFGGKCKALVLPDTDLPPILPSSWREVIFSG